MGTPGSSLFSPQRAHRGSEASSQPAGWHPGHGGRLPCHGTPPRPLIRSRNRLPRGPPEASLLLGALPLGVLERLLPPDLGQGLPDFHQPGTQEAPLPGAWGPPAPSRRPGAGWAAFGVGAWPSLRPLPGLPGSRALATRPSRVELRTDLLTRARRHVGGNQSPGLGPAARAAAAASPKTLFLPQACSVSGGYGGWYLLSRACIWFCCCGPGSCEAETRAECSRGLGAGPWGLSECWAWAEWGSGSREAMPPGLGTRPTWTASFSGAGTACRASSCSLFSCASCSCRQARTCSSSRSKLSVACSQRALCPRRDATSACRLATLRGEEQAESAVCVGWQS